MAPSRSVFLGLQKAVCREKPPAYSSPQDAAEVQTAVCREIPSFPLPPAYKGREMDCSSRLPLKPPDCHRLFMCFHTHSHESKVTMLWLQTPWETFVSAFLSAVVHGPSDRVSIARPQTALPVVPIPWCLSGWTFPGSHTPLSGQADLSYGREGRVFIPRSSTNLSPFKWVCLQIKGP